MSSILSVTMAISLPERALIVKLFYENHGNAAAALREFRRRKMLRSGPMSPQGVRDMISRFEKTGSLCVQRGRGRKPISAEVVSEVATAVVEQSLTNDHGISSARSVSRQLGMSYSTVWKILRKIVKFYPYKISHNQTLLDTDIDRRLSFALTFLARVEVDDSWPWNILWSDEAHFYLNGDVNNQNCRIWAMEYPRAFHTIPLHSPKVTVWCGFTSQFILGPFFFEENQANGPVTCSVTALRYRDMLNNFVLPQLQQRQCLTTITFMQDGAPPHNGLCVQRFLRQHFTDDRVISRSFPTSWPARSPDLTPCDFWLWGHLKNVVYQGNVATLADLKDRITLHVRMITGDQLRSAVEHTVHRLHVLHLNEGGHIEQFALHR